MSKLRSCSANNFSWSRLTSSRSSAKREHASSLLKPPVSSGSILERRILWPGRTLTVADFTLPPHQSLFDKFPDRGGRHRAGLASLFQSILEHHHRGNSGDAETRRQTGQ